MQAVLMTIGLVALLAGQEPPLQPQRFAGIMTAGPLTPNPAAIEIGVDRWSTDETRVGLADIFHAGGQAALLDALKKAGIAAYVRMANHERLQVAYAQQDTPATGGRRVLLLCVRYPGDWELSRDSGWTDHPFRLIAITFDARNRGSGMLFHTAQVTFGKDGPELVSELSGQPTKIVSIQRTR
jgi:hypothetical protein